MSETNDRDVGQDGQDAAQEAKGRLSLRPAGRLELGRTVDAGSVKQSFSHGRTKTVQVEVRKTRVGAPKPAYQATPQPALPANLGAPRPAPVAPAPRGRSQAGCTRRHARPASPARPGMGGRALTPNELAVRQRVLLEQQKVLQEQSRENAKREAERREQEKISILSAAEEARRREEDARRQAEEEARASPAEQARAREAAPSRPPLRPRTASPEAVAAQAQPPGARPAPSATPRSPASPAVTPTETLRLRTGREEEEEARGVVRRPGGVAAPRACSPRWWPRRALARAAGPAASTCRPRSKARTRRRDRWPACAASASASAGTPSSRPCAPTRCVWCATWCCRTRSPCRSWPTAWPPVPSTWSRR